MLNKYALSWTDFRAFAEARRIFTVAGLSRELLIDYKCEWDTLYPSSNTRQMVSHRLRDRFAVDLLENGVTLEEVSKLLGHERIKTTERHYSKWMQGRQDRLDSLVTAVWPKRKKH